MPCAEVKVQIKMPDMLLESIGDGIATRELFFADDSGRHYFSMPCLRKTSCNWSCGMAGTTQ